MKIVDVQSIPFRIPLKKSTEWARGKIDAAEHVLVKVFTDQGIIGIAEAPPRPSIYGESIASIKFAVDNWLRPIIIGMEPFEIERIWDKFDLVAANNTAKAAIDIALYDIMGKALNLPCYKLMGSYTETVRLSWGINLNPLKEMVREGQEMVENYGMKAFKLKIGMEPEKDIEMVKTIRQELGEDLLLYVDANQGYDPFTALRVADELMAYNIALFEEPCPIWDKRGRKMVADRISIPFVGDESCLTTYDVMKEIEGGSVRVVSIKPARTGFTQSRKIINLCEANGIRNIHGYQGDTSVGSIASAHVCAGFKNTSYYYPSEAAFFLLQTDDFLKEPLVVKGGCLKLTKKPGLGIEVDEEKLQKFAL